MNTDSFVDSGVSPPAVGSRSTHHYSFLRLLRREKNLTKHILQSSRKQAKRRGVEFTITEDDLPFPLPTHCPVLGIKLDYFSTGKIHAPNVASLDRWDNSKGYVPGNIKIISYRANTLKSNATTQEIRAVLLYMLGWSASKSTSKTSKPCKVCGAVDRNLHNQCRPCHRERARLIRSRKVTTQ